MAKMRIFGVIKSARDKLQNHLLEDECEELRLRCASLELELQLREKLEKHLEIVINALSEVLEIFADGREAMTPQDQARLVTARRALKDNS